MFKAFVAKYSGVTHAIAGIWSLAVVAYTTNYNGFRDMINQDAVAVYHSLPPLTAKVVSSLITIGFTLYALYRTGLAKPQPPLSPQQQAPEK